MWKSDRKPEYILGEMTVVLVMIWSLTVAIARVFDSSWAIALTILPAFMIVIFMVNWVAVRFWRAIINWDARRQS